MTRIRSSAAKDLISKIMLKNKKTGEMKAFNCVNESDLKKIYEHAVITDFNMSKLEVEYDYDTDSEQITHSHKMLFRELA